LDEQNKKIRKEKKVHLPAEESTRSLWSRLETKLKALEGTNEVEANWKNIKTYPRSSKRENTSNKIFIHGQEY